MYPAELIAMESIDIAQDFLNLSLESIELIGPVSCATAAKSVKDLCLRGVETSDTENFLCTVVTCMVMQDTLLQFFCVYEQLTHAVFGDVPLEFVAVVCLAMYNNDGNALVALLEAVSLENHIANLQRN